VNLFHDKFSTGQVVTAANVPSHTLQSWLKRDVIIGHKEAPIEGAGSSGVHRRFSFHNVMEIAVAKGLIDAGMSDLEAAFFAATRFAHTGRAEIGHGHPRRYPSLPFERQHGFTILCVRGQNSKITTWKPGSDFLAGVFQDVQGQGFVLVEVNSIFDRVVTLLGYDPHQTMHFGYSNSHPQKSGFVE
jgi:hypothetical protein